MSVSISTFSKVISQPVPNSKNGKQYNCFVRVSEVPNLNLGKKTGPNPRKPTKGEVHRGIRETLKTLPKIFQLKNAGMILAASDIVATSKNIQINFGSASHHGIIDGNNTRVTIEALIAEDPDLDLSNVWIPVCIFTNLSRKEIEAVAEGHNIRKKVERYSLLNYLGLFDCLKSSLVSHFGSDIIDIISWCEGDKLPTGHPKPVHVSEIIQVIETLNLNRYGKRMSSMDIASPVLYGNKGKAFSNFAEDITNGVGERLMKFTPEVLETYHTICAELERAWNSCGGQYAYIGGRLEKPGGKRIVPKQYYNFIQKESSSNCQPLALLILSSLRTNVKWGEKLSWHMNPMAFLNGTMTRSVQRIYKNVGAATHKMGTIRGSLEHEAKYNSDLYELLYNDTIQYLTSQGKVPSILP